MLMYSSLQLTGVYVQDVILPGYQSSMVTLGEFKEFISPYTTTPVQYRERCRNMEVARETAEFWGLCHTVLCFMLQLRK